MLNSLYMTHNQIWITL